ncbi:MAG TPA: hypothetical protein VK604_11410 [Bryobacteraceae bacterium]|nr:hypothetical protein [Bryobacteraceae bacterium]
MGSRATATVFKGTELRTGRRIAVKIPEAEAGADRTGFGPSGRREGASPGWPKQWSVRCGERLPRSVREPAGKRTLFAFAMGVMGLIPATIFLLLLYLARRE